MRTSALIPYHRVTHLAQSLHSCRLYFDEVLTYGDNAEEAANMLARDYSTVTWNTAHHVYAFEARNRLLSRCQADIIVFHDSDDYRLPATQVHLDLFRDSDADVLVTPYEGRTLAGDAIIDIARGNVQTGGIYIKRTSLDFIPQKAHAWEYWLLHDLLVRGKKFMYHPEPGVHYRKNWSEDQITKASYGYVIASRQLCLGSLLENLSLSPCQYNALKQGMHR